MSGKDYRIYDRERKNGVYMTYHTIGKTLPEPVNIRRQSMMISFRETILCVELELELWIFLFEEGHWDTRVVFQECRLGFRALGGGSKKRYSIVYMA